MHTWLHFFIQHVFKIKNYDCDGLCLGLFLFRFTHHQAPAVICGWRRRVGMCEKVKPQTESCEAAGCGQTRGLPYPLVEHLTVRELPLGEPDQPWCVENSVLQSAGVMWLEKDTRPMSNGTRRVKAKKERKVKATCQPKPHQLLILASKQVSPQHGAWEFIPVPL